MKKLITGLLFLCILPLVFADYDDNSTVCISGGYNWINNSNYGGTYDFTDDTIGQIASGWAGASGVIEEVVSEFNGHNKVFMIDDDGSSSTVMVTQSWGTTHAEGTIEFWVYPSNTDTFVFQNRNQYSNVGFTLYFVDNEIQRFGIPNVKIADCASGEWHHIRIDYASNVAGYMGLGTYSWFIYLDGVKYGPFSYVTNQQNWDRFSISILSGEEPLFYLDAVGYSWDEDYEIGDNSFAGCCGDDGGNDTFYNGSLNSTLHFCQEGNFVESSIDANQSVCETWGYSWLDEVDYPGTYSFTDDADGTNPTDWVIECEGGSTIDVVSGYEGHNKVLKIHDYYTAACGCTCSWSVVYTTFDTVTSGTVEYWILSSEASTKNYVSLYEDSTQILTFRPGGSGGWQFYNGTWYTNGTHVANHWYHIRMDFDLSNYWHLYVDGEPIAIGGTYDLTYSATPTSGVNKLRVFLDNYNLNTRDLYFDAVSFSWDTNYTLGSNILPQCCGDDGSLDNFSNSSLMCVNGNPISDVDLDQSSCETSGYAWFENTITGSLGPCCGDDGAGESFYNGTISSTEYFCYEGSLNISGLDGNSTLCGNYSYAWFENNINGTLGACCGDDGAGETFFNGTIGDTNHFCYEGSLNVSGIDNNQTICESYDYSWFTNNIIGDNYPRCCGDDYLSDYFGNTSNCCTYGVFTESSCSFSPAGCSSDHVDTNNNEEWDAGDSCGLGTCSDYYAVDSNIDSIWDGYCYSGALNTSCISTNLPPFNTSFTVTVRGNLTEIVTLNPVIGEQVSITVDGTPYTDTTDEWGGWEVEVTYWELNCATSNLATASFSKDGKDYTASKSFTAVK